MRSAKATFEVSVFVPGHQGAVFDFFEDPRSMMFVPGVKSVRGEGGLGGVVIVENDDGSGDEQHVIEFEPPNRTVVHARLTRVDLTVSHTETNEYVQAPGGTRVSRTVTISVEARKRRQWQHRLDAGLERVRQRHLRVLEALSAAFQAQSGGP